MSLSGDASLARSSVSRSSVLLTSLAIASLGPSFFNSVNLTELRLSCDVGVGRWGSRGGDESCLEDSVRGVVRRSGDCCVGDVGALEGSLASWTCVERRSGADVRKGGRFDVGGRAESDEASSAAEISSWSCRCASESSVGVVMARSVTGDEGKRESQRAEFEKEDEVDEGAVLSTGTSNLSC